jgi:soluble lytic murein transglycosylase-like protein
LRKLLMKKWIQAGILTLFAGSVAMLGYVLYTNLQLKKHVNHLEQDQLMADAAKDFQEMELYISKKSESESKSTQKSGYQGWMKADKLSSQFEESSDGHFKKEWGMFLVREAERRGVDPYIVYELLRVESGEGFDPKAVGPQTKYGRAYGMAQFMKNTAPWIAEMANMPYDENKLFDPYYSIQLSIVYLDYLHAKYDNWDKALTAYHRGMFGMEQYIQEKGHAKSQYAREIQQEAKKQETVAVNNN